jgi:hypothetical protein
LPLKNKTVENRVIEWIVGPVFLVGFCDEKFLLKPKKTNPSLRDYNLG